MSDAGKTSLGNLLMLAVLAAIAYAAVLYVPLWVDNLEVKEAVHVAFNISGRNTNDAVLRNVIKERTSRLGTHWEDDGFGRMRQVPGLGLTDEQITIERDPVTQSVRIDVRYQRELKLKPTEKVLPVSFHVVREGIPPR